MNANEPALFDMPAAEQPAMSQPRQRGRNREAWARTVTAEITIVDAEALCEAARRVQESAVTMTLPALPHGGDLVAEDPAVTDAADAFDALAWLLWPTDGMEAPLETGAFRILSVDIEVEPDSDDRGTLAWTVTVKLTDILTLRRLAAQAYFLTPTRVPDAHGLPARAQARHLRRGAMPLQVVNLSEQSSQVFIPFCS